jgi:hypothetical protein
MILLTSIYEAAEGAFQNGSFAELVAPGTLESLAGRRVCRECLQNTDVK